jgi:hypothetical protein
VPEKIQEAMTIIDSSFSLAEAKKRLASKFEDRSNKMGRAQSKKSIKAVQAPITPSEVRKVLENLRAGFVQL